MPVRLAQIARIQLGYQPRSRLVRRSDGSHRLIQIRDVSPSGIELSSLARVHLDRSPDRYEVHPGDILHVARGEHLHPILVTEMPFPAVAISFFYIIRPDVSVVMPEYLRWALQQPLARAHIRQHTRGTGIPMLTRQGIDTITIDLPDLQTQRAITNLVALSEKERYLSTMLMQQRTKLIHAACRLAAAGAS